MLKIDCRCPPQGAVVFPSLAPPPPPPACPPLTQPSPSSPSLAPMGSPSGGKGVSQLSLPTPFSPIFVCSSAYWNLSPILLFTHQLLTSAVFALGLSFVFIGFSPRFHFCTSLLFATSPFVCHLLQTRHIDRLPQPMLLEEGILAIEVTVWLQPHSTNTSLWPELQQGSALSISWWPLSCGDVSPGSIRGF